MSINMSPRQIIGLVGAALLLLGLFIDPGGDASYYEGYPLPGVLIAVLAVGAILLAVINPERLLSWLLPAVGVLALLLVLSTKLRFAFAPWTDVSAWGELALFGGAFVLLIAGAISRKMPAPH